VNAEDVSADGAPPEETWNADSLPGLEMPDPETNEPRAEQEVPPGQKVPAGHDVHGGHAVPRGDPDVPVPADEGVGLVVPQVPRGEGEAADAARVLQLCPGASVEEENASDLEPELEAVVRELSVDLPGQPQRDRELGLHDTPESKGTTASLGEALRDLDRLDGHPPRADRSADWRQVPVPSTPVKRERSLRRSNETLLVENVIEVFLGVEIRPLSSRCK
jgi:hypothetical protein